MRQIHSATMTKTHKTTIKFGYITSNTGSELEVPVFTGEASKEITIQLSPSSEHILGIISAVTPPKYLHAINEQGKAKLEWEAAVSQVTSYNIYSKQEKDALFKLLKTVPATSFSLQTDHQFKTPRRFYAISSIDSNGNENILTGTISNDSRRIIKQKVKGFHWPMFLPAITVDQQ